PRPGVDRHQGLCSAGRGTDVCPSPGPGPTYGRHLAALRGVARPANVACRAGGVADGIGAGGRTPAPGATPARPHAPRVRPSVAGVHLVPQRRFGASACALRARHGPQCPTTGPCPCLPVWPRCWGGVHLLVGLDPVAARLSRSGATERPRGPHTSPAAGPAARPGICSGLGGLAPSVAPRAADRTRPGGGRYGFVYGAGVCSTAGVRACAARLGAHRAATGRRWHHPYTPGVGCLSGYGSSRGTAAAARPAGRGACAGRTGRSRAGGARGSVDGGGTHGGTELRSGTPSAHRAVAAGTLRVPSYGG